MGGEDSPTDKSSSENNRMNGEVVLLLADSF